MAKQLCFGLKLAAEALLLVSLSACVRETKPDPAAALDKAYKAGLLTKEEYDAKWQTLPGASSTTVAGVTSEPPSAPPSAPPATPPPPAPPSEAPGGGGNAPAAPKGASESSPAAARPASPPQPPALPARSAARDTAVEVGKKVQQKENQEGPALAAGCEDEEFKSGGQKSDTRFYAAPLDAVQHAAASALDALDFNVNKNTPKEIEAQKRRHVGAVIGAGGEKVKLTFKKAEEGGKSGTLVTGETKKNFVGRLAQRSWTEAVLAQTACKLREAN